MKKLIFLSTILLSSMLFSQEKDSVEVPKIVVRIPLGETAQIGENTVRFVEVLEDSRCPKNVTCIWQGRVRVRVEVVTAQSTTELIDLLFGQSKPGESITTILYASDGYFLEGIQVIPYPDVEDTDEKKYVLLVAEKS